jgi:hypothetical protein
MAAGRKSPEPAGRTLATVPGNENLTQPPDMSSAHPGVLVWLPAARGAERFFPVPVRYARGWD